MKRKLIRITTVPQSLGKLLQGQLAYMSAYYDVVGVSSDGEVLDKVAMQEGVRTFAVKMTRKITPWADLRAVWRLYRFFKREKPLIVHTHTPKAGIVGMLAARLAGVPVRMHTVAGLPLLEASGWKRRILDLVESVTYGCATMIYPNSFVMKAIIEELRYAKPAKLKVLAHGSSNGIDLAYFAPEAVTDEQCANLKQELGIEQGDFTFVFVGRLVGDKGIRELVEAFDAISAERPDVKLLLVGQAEPELDPLPECTIQTIARNRAIVAVGYQSDVRPYFAVADALAFPSYREGFPNVVIQAGAMGLPSIVTDINGCNEIIADGVNGLVIPSKDSESLQTAMLRVMDDSVLRTRLQENAREIIASRYDRQTVWNALLGEYKALENK